MGYRRTVIIALAATALAASGCGSSSSSSNGGSNNNSGNTGASKPLTRAELVAKADAICKSINARLNATGASSNKGGAQVFLRLAAFEQTALAELEKFNPPAVLAGDWRQIVASGRTLAADTAKYSEYTKLKNPTAAQSVVVSGDKIRQQASTMARSDGFNDCAQAF